MKCKVVITLTLEAKNSEAAFEVGVAAVKHLLETFNDDQSIHPMVEVASEEMSTD
jgi:hypothetical protein